MDKDRKIPYLLAAVCVALLCAPLLEMGYHGIVERRVPSDRDWQAAAALVGAGHRAGDLVVITPWWATQGWTRLGRFVTLEQMARDDDRGWGRIWEVAWKGRGREEYRRTGKLLEEERAGRLTVRLWSFPGAPATLFDFVKEIERAKVEMTAMDGAQPRPCAFRPHPARGTPRDPAVQAGKFACDPGRPWNYVAREVIADLENKPRLCVWAHPIVGERVRVTFTGVPKGASIEGYTGLKYEADRETQGKPPVYMDVFADGALVGSAMHEERGGWTPWKFALPGEWQGGGEVRFEVYSSYDGMQHFCFTAKLRDK